MKWFTGSINDAVATSKSRKAVFVVFVAGLLIRQLSIIIITSIIVILSCNFIQ